MSRVPSVAPTEGGGSLMVAWRLEGRRVLVVGGGTVAAGRVRQALDADARVVVVAPILNAELRHRWSTGGMDWRPAEFADTDLDAVDLVLACLDDHEESAHIASLARARRVPINCADHVDLCDFWFASAHREGPLQLALSTNGNGPAMGSRLVREIASALPRDIGTALSAFGRLRAQVRQVDPASTSSKRRMGWLAHVARTWAWDDLASLDDAAIERLLAAYVAGEAAPDGPPVVAEAPSRPGRVRLVGAGPGNPDLLTIAARKALEEADLVLADRLVPPEILDLVSGELRIARKLPGRAQDAQDELDAWTIEAALAGRDVVRLKCGDPFVFGRGGEELVALAQHGLDAEVIPGVSSALAAPLSAGIPTTMRGYADRVMILTGQGRDGARVSMPTFDADTTYVFLMGVGRLETLAADLAATGFPAHWPAALVERATHPGQRSVRGTLDTLAQVARDASIAAPATLVIGRVVEALASAQVSEVVARAAQG